LSLHPARVSRRWWNVTIPSRAVAGGCRCYWNFDFQGLGADGMRGNNPSREEGKTGVACVLAERLSSVSSGPALHGRQVYRRGAALSKAKLSKQFQGEKKTSFPQVIHNPKLLLTPLFKRFLAI
jgi:hypothetical protein